MTPTDANDFLMGFGGEFENEVARNWRWSGQDDDDFGKMESWTVRPYDPDNGQTVEVVASIDLQLTQLQLSISERDMTNGLLSAADTTVVFDALIQFEDQTLTVGGEEREYSESEIRLAIQEFNDKVR